VILDRSKASLRLFNNPTEDIRRPSVPFADISVRVVQRRLREMWQVARNTSRWATIVAVMAFASPAFAQERIDDAAIEKIKAEGLQRSQVMETASWLTDVFGARLTGSPNIKAAGEWAAKKLTEWGMVNAKLEPWGYFGRGWTNDRLSLHVIAPTPWPVIAYSAAWTPGTNGTVTGAVVRIVADSAADLQKYRGKLKNAFVMLVPKRDLNPSFTPDAERYTEAGLDSLETPPAARAGGAGRGGRGGGRGGAGGAPSFRDRGGLRVVR
jgi:hypothetical protein